MIISFTMKYTIDNVARAVAAKTLYDERIVKEVAMYMFKKALEKNNEFGVTSVIVGHFGYFTQNLAELKKFYKRNEKNIAFTKKYVTDDYDRRMTRLLERREDLKIRIVLLKARKLLNKQLKDCTINGNYTITLDKFKEYTGRDFKDLMEETIR